MKTFFYTGVHSIISFFWLAAPLYFYLFTPPFVAEKKKKNSYETTDFETVHRRPNLCKSNQSESNILARKNERNLYKSKLIFQLNVYSNSTKKVIYIPYKTRVTQWSVDPGHHGFLLLASTTSRDNGTIITFKYFPVGNNF